MASTNVDREIKELRNNVSELKSIIKSHAKEAASEVLGVTSINQYIKDLAKSSGETVKEVLDNSKKAYQETRNEYQEKIANNPFKSAALAFGAGAVLALIFGRK